MSIRNATPKRSSASSARIQAIVKRRTGITRHTLKLSIHGIPVQAMKSPEIVCERSYRTWLGRHSKLGRKKNDTIHFSVVRFTFRADDGRVYTALQGRAFDANRGHVLSVTGFWNVREV